ncbi:hypothetical protein U0A60_08630, partial [Escherichia coli]|nr:hypothetical protein [Escherichia coli]
YLVLYNSKRPHKALALMTPVEYILKENKNCNMWWTHTPSCDNRSLRVEYCRLTSRKLFNTLRNVHWDR